MHSIVNGLHVYCAGDSKNPAIVFLHGFPFDAGMWHKQVSHLCSTHFCISYDIRGLGKSEVGDGQYTIEGFVDDLIAVLNTLNVYTASLCALSMGGYIALRAVQREHIRFNKLILCDTRADADANAGKLKRAATIKRIAEIGSAKFVAEFLPTCVSEAFRTTATAEYEGMVAKYGQSSTIGLRGCQLAMMGRTDCTDFLAEIDLPTLVLCGEHDSFSPPALMQSMAQGLAGSQFHLVPGAGHMAPLENADFVNPIISGFLNE